MQRLRHPIRSIREPFGTAGLIVAVVALVLALTGAALAAGGLTGQQKKEVKKIAKQFAGKQGPAGAQGPAGPQGPQGTPGANGKDGAQGPQGDAGIAGPAGPKGATGAQGATGPAGATGPTGATGATGSAGAAGSEGSPWTAGGTLPSGETETGTWALGLSAAGVPVNYYPFSFPIPLANALEAKAGVVEFVEPGEGETENCPGTVENPEAEPGHLCIYAKEMQNVSYLATPRLFVSGAVSIFAFGEEPGAALGTWAVTAP